MKYELHETIVVVFEVEAESMDHALEVAFELTEKDRLYENTHGFTYIRELTTNNERIL
jgi:hypothetical protein